MFLFSFFGDGNFLPEFKPKNKVPNVSELILNISTYIYIYIRQRFKSFSMSSEIKKTRCFIDSKRSQHLFKWIVRVVNLSGCPVLGSLMTNRSNSLPETSVSPFPFCKMPKIWPHYSM